MNNDLIDRQAAIDALTDYIHNIDRVMGTGKLTMYDCKDAAESVLGEDELPSADVQPVRNWIPVSKDLPKIPIRVQVQLDNSWIITAYYDEGEWYGVPGDDEPIDGVLAWMPLPEPYKDGEQND